MADETSASGNDEVTGRLSRRQFISWSSALTLGAMGLVDVPAADAAADMQPRRGGRARVCMDTSRPDEYLDPMRSNTRQAHVRQFILYNSLVTISSDFKPVPELAASWSSTPDARQWMFTLRKGVTFHNGKALTSADVVYSLRRHIGPKSESQAKALMKAVTDVQAEDTSTVRVTLSEPMWSFPLFSASIRR
jgi:peptide/nickel transport system substrate-binding protein